MQTMIDVPSGTPNEPGSDGSNSNKFDRLIERARAGDEGALGHLLDNCRDYLLFIANHNLDQDLQKKLGASDVVQESMIVAHQKFDQFHGTDRAQLLAWLRGILINDVRTVRRFYKQSKKRNLDLENSNNLSAWRRPSLLDDSKTPGAKAVAREEADCLRAAMEQLSPSHRQVIQLRNWQQLSFAEIGEQTNKSADAARKLWSRAVMELERLLQQEFE